MKKQTAALAVGAALLVAAASANAQKHPWPMPYPDSPFLAAGQVPVSYTEVGVTAFKRPHTVRYPGPAPHLLTWGSNTEEGVTAFDPGFPERPMKPWDRLRAMQGAATPGSGPGDPDLPPGFPFLSAAPQVVWVSNTEEGVTAFDPGLPERPMTPWGPIRAMQWAPIPCPPGPPPCPVGPPPCPVGPPPCPVGPVGPVWGMNAASAEHSVTPWGIYGPLPDVDDPDRVAGIYGPLPDVDDPDRVARIYGPLPDVDDPDRVARGTPIWWYNRGRGTN